MVRPSRRGPRNTARNWTEHHRVIPLQTAEWAALAREHRDAELCVAGDFNMNLGGKHSYGTAAGRTLMRDGLARASLVCLTDAEHTTAGLLSAAPIDHICWSDGPLIAGATVEAWSGKDEDDVRLSDHSGLVVTL